MSVCSNEDPISRYTELVSDIDPDEYNVIESDSEDYSYRNHTSKKVSLDTKIDDPGYNCIRRVMNGRPVKIAFYETSTTPNVYIRDAVSGVRCSPYRVGTVDEDLFFSVILATGETGRRNPSVLFYDNPEQYERHFYTEVSPTTKQAWLNKVSEARREQETRQQLESQKSRQSIQVK